MRARFLLSAVVIASLIGLFCLWSAGWLDFSTLKARHDDLAAYAAARPVATAAIYFVVFVVATSLSIPLATLLTLLGGSVFGFAEALLLVSYASTVGATLAMLLSRHLLRSLVERRWPHWVSMANRGVEQDGAFYLLFLRMAPAPPYFMVNLLFGITRLPVRTFFIVTQIGMLPFDAVFVNAGRALAQLSSPADVLDADTMLALSLAGVLPLLLRKGWRLYQGSRMADEAD